MKDILAYIVICAMIACMAYIIAGYEIPASIMGDDYTVQFKKMGTWIK
jgi:hypothetical protein